MTDGVPEKAEGVLDYPIEKMPGSTVKRTVREDGKPSCTRHKTLRAGNGHALMLLELETGRTHQIRVHLSHIGCPVRGDFLYGTEQPEEYPGCFALHSAIVELLHPITGEKIVLTSLPEWAEGIDRDVLFMDFS